MLHGKQTSTVVIDDKRIKLYYEDGDVYWQYEDVELYGKTLYTAEVTEMYDARQGTDVLGYELLLEPIDIPSNQAPRVFASIRDNTIDWVGGLSASPLDEYNLNQRGERL